MMETAREMFESLGYECSKSDIKIEYSCGVENIIFLVNEHDFYTTKCINVDEFKAIQQQMKELGWI